MKEPSSNSKPWRPFTANCCSTEDQTIFRNFSRCKPSRSEFRRLSFSDLSRSSSIRINEDLAQSFSPDLYDFQLSELRAITQNFSSNLLLGEAGFGTVHKGYIDDNLRQGLKAQPVAVKLLDNEGLQGHCQASSLTRTLLPSWRPCGLIEKDLPHFHRYQGILWRIKVLLRRNWVINLR